MNNEDATPEHEVTFTLVGMEVSVAQLRRMEPTEVGMLLLDGLSRKPFGQPEFALPNVRALAEASAVESWRRSSGRRGTDPAYIALDLPQVLADAFAWLISRSLIGPASANSGSNGEFRLTTEGLAAAAVHSSAKAEAAIRLHVDLHPALSEARLNFERGSYQTAVFEATRQVEIRVRELAGLGDDRYGVVLMRAAFNSDNGPLATGQMKAEKDAIASLFAGAIGAFKNAASHRVVHFDDPTEAADILHLADLLLRMAERAATELPSV